VARLADRCEHHYEVPEGPVGLSRPAVSGRAERGLGCMGIGAESRSRDSADMATITSDTRLAVLPFESSIPPEVTLNQWRHRNLASAAGQQPRLRRMRLPLPRLASRAA